MSRLFLSPHKTSCSLWWSSLYFLFVHFWTFCRVGQNLRFTFFPTFWHIIDKMIHQLIDKIIFRLTNNEANWLLQHLICIQLNSQEHLFRNNCCTTTLLYLWNQQQQWKQHANWSAQRQLSVGTDSALCSVFKDLIKWALELEQLQQLPDIAVMNAINKSKESWPDTLWM